MKKGAHHQRKIIIVFDYFMYDFKEEFLGDERSHPPPGILQHPQDLPEASSLARQDRCASLLQDSREVPRLFIDVSV